MCELAGFFWILKAGGILWIFFPKKITIKLGSIDPNAEAMWKLQKSLSFDGYSKKQKFNPKP
jgi:hypothetical protein